MSSENGQKSTVLAPERGCGFQPQSLGVSRRLRTIIRPEEQDRHDTYRNPAKRGHLAKTFILRDLNHMPKTENHTPARKLRTSHFALPNLRLFDYHLCWYSIDLFYRATNRGRIGIDRID